jgi:hypothetical protein
MVLAFIKLEVYGAFPTDPYSRLCTKALNNSWNDWASKGRSDEKENWNKSEEGKLSFNRLYCIKINFKTRTNSKFLDFDDNPYSITLDKEKFSLTLSVKLFIKWVLKSIELENTKM